MKPEKEYLASLITETFRKADEFDYSEIDVSGTEVSYLATKKNNHLGLLDGIKGKADMQKLHVDFSNKIRSNCQFYNKFFYRDGKLCKVESYVDGHDRMDLWYGVYYEGNKRYLYGQKAKLYGSIFVTVYQDGKVYEEYEVAHGCQILYWKYDFSQPGCVNAYYINFVPGGNYPVLGESSMIFDTETLECKILQEHSWWQDQ